MEVLKSKHKEIRFINSTATRKYSLLTIGWQSPLFYLNYERTTIRNILYSFRIWMFYYNKDRHETFIRFMGFFKSSWVFN